MKTASVSGVVFYLRGKKAMCDFDERVCLCALNRVFGNWPVEGRGLVEKFGSAAAVFGASDDELREALGSREELGSCIGNKILEESAAELQRLEDKGGRFLGYTDEDYPSLLLECPDFPLGIYIKSGGSPTGIFEMRPCVAIVGTRDISAYGKEWCVRLVRAMANTKTPPVIVSGLALGTDGVAHATALECGLGTVGVMATGLDKIYPYSHTALADSMAVDPLGALVTDYPTGTAPVALNFIRRNRIIAGLCRATIVIESKRKGGSLLTARYATEYNRDLFALPGRIDDSRSCGCNSLISSGMASIIADPDELVDKLGLGGIKAMKRQNLSSFLASKYGNGSAPAVIGMLIKQNRGIDYETIAALSGLSWSEVTSATSILETDGIIITDFLQRCSIKP